VETVGKCWCIKYGYIIVTNFAFNYINDNIKQNSVVYTTVLHYSPLIGSVSSSSRHKYQL
jgi:hypothetical protein